MRACDGGEHAVGDGLTPGERRANDMGAPKQAQDADVVLPIDQGKRLWEGLSINMPGSREGALAYSWQRSAQHSGNRVTRGSGRDAMMAGLLTARRRGLAGLPSNASYVCALTGVCPLQVRCNSPAGGHEDWPPGRHDVHWVGCSDESLMEQHRGLFS